LLFVSFVSIVEVDIVDPATPTLVGASRRDGINVSERREGTSVCDHVGGEALSLFITEGIENSVYVGVGVMSGFNASQLRKASLKSIDGDGFAGGIENCEIESVGVGVKLGFNFSQFRKASLTSIDGDGIVEVNGTLLTEGGGDREGLTLVTGAAVDCDVGITGCSGNGVRSV